MQSVDHRIEVGPEVGQEPEVVLAAGESRNYPAVARRRGLPAVGVEPAAALPVVVRMAVALEVAAVHTDFAAEGPVGRRTDFEAGPRQSAAARTAVSERTAVAELELLGQGEEVLVQQEVEPERKDRRSL